MPAVYTLCNPPSSSSDCLPIAYPPCSTSLTSSSFPLTSHFSSSSSSFLLQNTHTRALRSFSGPLDTIKHRETTFHHTLEHYHPTGRGRNPSQRVSKSTYWYVVITDCALEFYEAHPPPMHYDLKVLNAGMGSQSDTFDIVDADHALKLSFERCFFQPCYSYE